MEKIQKLYKYLASKFVKQVVNKGGLLFRNLSYFRQYEDYQRGDPLEGFHRDNPDNDITLTNQSTGQVIKGDFSFLNSTDTDLIFVFCLSTELNQNLFKEFEADACIEIIDVDKFLKKTSFKVKRLLSCHPAGLLHEHVRYYNQNKPADFDIKDPKNLAFAKNTDYQHQGEYRLVFGTKKAFKLTQQIVVNQHYDFRQEAMKGTTKKKLVEIGSISDIVKVHYT